MNKRELLALDGLKESEKKILDVHWDWKHTHLKSNFFEISRKTQLSVPTIGLRLRQLNARGLIKRSKKGGWHITEGLRK